MMCLDSFRIAYYPGTEAPADYVSQISCQHIDGDIFARPIVSMNRIFSAQGYRFYQSSYDEDLEGSWLSVNYDPWGTGITYTGFCLMGLGCCSCCAPGMELPPSAKASADPERRTVPNSLVLGLSTESRPGLTRSQADTSRQSGYPTSGLQRPRRPVQHTCTGFRTKNIRTTILPRNHSGTGGEQLDALPRRMEPHSHYPYQKSGVAHRFRP